MSDSASGEYEEGASLGNFIWVRLKRDSWWPAQVVDESCVSESVRPRRGTKPDGEVLLRLYGSHEFLYADPAKCRSEFESVIERGNLSCRDMFLKSLEKDLPSAKSARAKERASTAKAKALIVASTPDSVSNRLKHKSRSAAEKARAEISRQCEPRSKSKALVLVDSRPCTDRLLNSKGEARKGSSEIGGSSKKPKANSSFPAETPPQNPLLEGVQQLSTRRIRVMRNIGSHREAERRRRERINAHLGTLRSLLPKSNTRKRDKASLLAEVVQRLKELSKQADDMAGADLAMLSGCSDVSMESCAIPGEFDEAILGYHHGGQKQGGKVVRAEATVCCKKGGQGSESWLSGPVGTASRKAQEGPEGSVRESGLFDRPAELHGKLDEFSFGP